MPPKRKNQRTARSQAASSSTVDVDVDEQSLRETFDVGSLPMDEAGASMSQQRQQDLRSPPRKPRGKKGGTKTKATSATTTMLTEQQRQPEDEEKEQSSGDNSYGGETGAAAGAAASGGNGSLAEHTLESLIAGGSAVASAADSILSIYRRGDQATALCTLLNLVAKAAGVREVELDVNALADGIDISPLLEELYARVPVDSEAYTLANRDPRFRRFRKTFPEFAGKVVQLAWSADVLLDGVLLPTLAQWVITMSESKLRSFRHTATVMLLGLLRGLNVLHGELTERVTLARTRKEVAALEASQDEVARWRDHFFSQAIHQRVRDVAPEIRLCVFQVLKAWVLTYKEAYMTNQYLRYFGMPLHDKRPELRAEALDMIWQALYSVPGAYGRMHLFLQYFINRLVEMCDDVDLRCSELAIRIVAMLVREDSEAAEGNELLSTAMIDRVLLTLFDERPTIRTAAGLVLKVFIHCRTADEAAEDEQQEVRVATELLCSFASTLRAQYAERMPERYLIDALWTSERLPLLLTEYGPMLETARAADATSMDVVVGLSLLTALLAKAQGRLTLGPAPKDDRRGVAAVTRRLPRGTQEAATDLVRRVSADLAASLGSILEQHRDDASVLAAVGNAVAALDLAACGTGRQARDLEALLAALRSVTLTAPASESVRDALVAAWEQVTHSRHILQTSAQGHAKLLTEALLKQAAEVEERAAAAGGTGKGGGSATGIDIGNARLVVWARANLASALAPCEGQWPMLRAALARQLARVNGDANAGAGDGACVREHVVEDEAAAQAFELLEWMLGAAVNGVLWDLHTHVASGAVANVDTANENGSNNSGSNAVPDMHTHSRLVEVVACLLECLSAGDAVLRDGAAAAHPVTVAAIVSLRTRALVHLCDLAALQLYSMSQSEQETLVDAFDSLSEYWAAQLRMAQDVVKATVSQQHQQQRAIAASGGSSTSGSAAQSQIAAARHQLSHIEASQMRLATGVTRLFLFKRLDEALAPRVLVQWTQTTSKAVSDTFKGLLHVLRDRAGDSFQLERDILVTAYTRCAEVGATPVSVDALYQIGAKLASMHFAATDRFYSAVIAMVQFASEFAATTDPLILHGALPYCGKLRAVDALRLVRNDLAIRDVFTSATNPYVRAFVGAMRKTARVEEYLAGSSASGAAATASTKRRRSFEHTLQDGERDEQLLHEVARSASSAMAGGGGAKMVSSQPIRAASGNAVARMSVATHAIADDGWREVASSQPLHPQPRAPTYRRAKTATASSRRRAPVDMPTSQEMALSSLADGINTEEAFIATEEFE